MPVSYKNFFDKFFEIIHLHPANYPKKMTHSILYNFCKNVIQLPYIKSSINEIGEDLILIRGSEVQNEKKMYCKLALYGALLLHAWVWQ